MSSSDLERARALSHRLASAAADATASRIGVEAPDASRFARFRPRAAAGTPAAEPSLATRPAVTFASGPPPVPANAFGAGAWRPVLSWCLAAGAAESAFLIDAQGLVVAAEGPLPTDAVQALGARLIVALEQARRMGGPDAGDVLLVVHLGPLALSGFPVTLPDGTVLTVGLAGTTPAPAGLRDAVARAVAGG